jgi:hypothetical protein
MMIQLHPDREGHWALFEKFERRCVAFGERSGWPLNGELRKEMRQRFVAQPLLAGYFVAEGAHLLAWVIVLYGRPGILIYQCEGAPGEIAPMLSEFFDCMLPSWIQEIENATKRQIEFVEVNVAADRERPWVQLLGRYRRVSARRTMTVLDLEPLQEGRGLSKENGNGR